MTRNPRRRPNHPSWAVTRRTSLSLRESTASRLQKIRRELKVVSLSLTIDLLVSGMTDEELRDRIERETAAEAAARWALQH